MLRLLNSLSVTPVGVAVQVSYGSPALVNEEIVMESTGSLVGGVRMFSIVNVVLCVSSRNALFAVT